jgi:hypothetical protein
VYRSDVRLVWVRISVEFCSDDAGGHCQNGDLFGGTNGIHLFVSELDLPGVHIVDQFVAVHEVNADNVVVQLVDDIHRMSELLPFDIKVYFIDSIGIYCIPGSATQLYALAIFLGFWFPNAALKDLLFMQVIAAPVSNNHDIVWLPVLTLTLGLIFSPGAKMS